MEDNEESIGSIIGNLVWDGVKLVLTVGVAGGIVAGVVLGVKGCSDFKKDLETKHDYLSQIYENLGVVDESKIPDLDLYDIELSDIPGARFRKDGNKKFLDVIAVEYGTGYQYRFGYEISDEFYNQNKAKIDELSSSATFLTEEEKKDVFDIKTSTFEMLRDLVASQKFTELAVAEAEGDKFQVIASDLENLDLTKAENLKDTNVSNISIPYSLAGEELSGYQL